MCKPTMGFNWVPEVKDRYVIAPCSKGVVEGHSTVNIVGVSRHHVVSLVVDDLISHNFSPFKNP